MDTNIYVDDYCKQIAEMIKNGEATIQKDVEIEVYVKGKGNKEFTKEKRIADIITITIYSK